MSHPKAAFTLFRADALPVVFTVAVTLGIAWRLATRPAESGLSGSPVSITTPQTGGAATHASLSDARLKTQQRPLENAVATIQRLRLKRFQLHAGQLDGVGNLTLSDESVPSMGVIAQDAVQAVPEAVYRPENDRREFWAVDYTRFVPLLLRAIQEQKSDLQSHETQIQNLKSELGQLREDVRRQFDEIRSSLTQLEGHLKTVDSSAREAFAQVHQSINKLEKRCADCK